MHLALTLPAKSKEPLYRQLAEALRDAILKGQLRPGQKLPSSRALAESMSVSRETASRSYEELASLGLIRVTAGSGVVVSEDCPLLKSSQPTLLEPQNDSDFAPPAFSPWGSWLMHANELADPTTFLRPEFNYDAPSVDELPVQRWVEMLRNSARLDNEGQIAYINDPLGFVPLRQALAEYLARRRGIHVSTSQIAVFNTTEGGNDLICRLLLQPGDRAAVENPGYIGIRMTYTGHGAEIVPIPVDGEGIVVEHLRRQPGIKMVYVTPCHHDPSGVAMSDARRRQLLDWARDTNAFIIEDDFDSEYRHGERLVPALKGSDDVDAVIYRYNFWRSLYPLVRMSFMVLPKRLAPAVWRAKNLIDRDVPLVEQRALGELIKQGHLERHMRRTFPIYAKRRQALVQALSLDLKSETTISPISAGMHLLVRFSPNFDERHIVEAASFAGLPLRSTRPNYLKDFVSHEFMIGFAYRDESEIRSIVSRFSKRLKELSK